jgi:hypothetical protein
MAEQPLETDDAAGLVPPTAGPPADTESPDDAERQSDDASSQRFTSRGPVIIRDRFLIDTGAPLPELDSPSAKAFNVEDRQDLGRKLFGLVCTPDLPTRIGTMRFLKRELCQGMIPLADWDVAPWPPFGQNTMIVIYDQPLGGRVETRLARKETRITEYDVPRRLVEPLLTPLQNLEQDDAAHRAIRADNLFFMDADMTEIVLGEHVTSPPGYDQPIMYEPIERAMASVEGRGSGNSVDDIFALGVTIGLLVLGHNPLAKMNDEDQIKRRLEQGSYAAIFGDARVPLPLLEPLRGMVNDDPETRWDFPEMSNWLTGQRSGSIKKKRMEKADSPFSFRRQDFISPRVLAIQFCKHVSEAAKAIQDNSFDTWLKRGLGDKAKADAVKSVIQGALFHKDGFQGSDDYLVSKVSTILDPNAPIRYKGFTLMPDGYGTFTAIQVVRNNNKEIVTQLLNHDIPAMWLNLQEQTFPGASNLTQAFAKLKGFLSINDPGYGIERLMYEICPSLPCHSPLLEKSCVVAIEHLLPALDMVSKHTDTQKSPVDRHIAAFIASRFDQDIHPHLKALAAPKEETSTVGMLSLLAFLQWKLRQPAMLGLSSWVGGLLGPAINSYHNRITRAEIEKNIPSLVRKGSLPELFDLVDNAERRQEDRDGYAEAQEEWLSAEEEIRDIEGAGNERLTKAERTGQQAAAMISILMAITTVTVLLIVEAW